MSVFDLPGASSLKLYTSDGHTTKSLCASQIELYFLKENIEGGKEGEVDLKGSEEVPRIWSKYTV